jgi:hypothetical protein
MCQPGITLETIFNAFPTRNTPDVEDRYVSKELFSDPKTREPWEGNLWAVLSDAPSTASSDAYGDDDDDTDLSALLD